MHPPFINAAPMVNMRGTQDLSTRQLVRAREAIPSHLPKSYIYAKKGPTKPMLVVGDSRVQVYGVDTFDLRKKFANHSTLLSNLVNAEGNSQMLERIIPDDAGPESNFVLYLDVLPKSISLYERNIDGSFKLNEFGDKTLLPLPPVSGYSVKWILTTRNGTNDIVSGVNGTNGFGAATILPGDQTSGATQSQRYPIMEVKASSVGEFGNNSGMRLWAPTESSSGGVNSSILNKALAYPYRVSMIRRLDTQSTPTIVDSQFSEQYITVTLKENVLDPISEKQLYIGDTLLDSYQNVSDPKYPDVIGDFGKLAVYQDNINALVKLFYQAEMPNGVSLNDYTNDFTGAVDEEHLFNFVGGTSSNGVPYSSFEFSTNPTTGIGVSTVRLSEFSNLFAANGSDGTMNDELFAASVIKKMTEYANENSSLMDTAINVESIMYDSGYPLATKYALCNFIATRKDTFVVLSTHDVNAKDLSASEEHSLAVALRTRLQMFPESDYFGTPVMRGMIVGRSGKLRNSQYTKRVPATMEVAIKSARYMGAGNGIWKSGYNFDGAPGSILDYISNLNITFTSSTARNKDWDIGLNWVQSYDRRSLFFPALKTVYNDDTSVLNSYFTALAICEINKVTQATWRDFSGVSHLSNAQLIERVNQNISARLLDRFDGRFVIVPDAQMTDDDLARGYSWTTPVKIYAPNMMTVMTTSVHAYRISDLVAV